MASKSRQRSATDTLQTAAGPLQYARLEYFAETYGTKLARLPFSIRILMESILRSRDGYLVTDQDVENASRWTPRDRPDREVPFMPARVLLQDFTGVPAVVDLAAMRSAIARAGGDPNQINPLIPADLVIDHSVQVDYFGTAASFQRNVEREYERNGERYALLRWGQRAFRNLRVVPPGTGICHQVNLEYLADVISRRNTRNGEFALLDTVLGTDSHTTMVNGLGVLGWGVGGIEAEAVLLGQPYYMVMPDVIGFKLTGQLRDGVTATDLVLTVTEMLRKKGVVEKFVEFYGPGLSRLPVPDRATISNMSPEYGATCGYFPIDQQTIAYLKGTGRPAEQVKLVEQYAKAQGLWHTDRTPDPQYTDTLELDMGTVEPSLAGPRRPEGRVALGDVSKSFRMNLEKTFGKTAPQDGGASAARAATATAVAERPRGVPVTLDSGEVVNLDHGAVVIAAITSCTNTSNPSVMIGAGLLARNAVHRGLRVRPWVKTSMAPGSRVVEDYMRASGLLPYLEALRFGIVGFGCTTCIGNSGPLPEAVGRAVDANDLVATAVLSGNRNFEGRVHQQVKANYLASPMLVVAFALAGTVDVDLTRDPIAADPNGAPVYLKDIWPSQQEIADAVNAALKPAAYRQRYASVFDGDERWRTLPVPEGDLYAWDRNSTYVQEPPYFFNMPEDPPPFSDVKGARALAKLGDAVTTDHISPAGNFSPKSPAGQYLLSKGVKPEDFNTYGARRGNHEVLVRGTFGNIRLRNELVPGVEGYFTRYLPTDEQTTIYEASVKYQTAGTPLIVVAGREYGNGSSRDWAAKGPLLLGVRAVIAEGFERIHRANLIGMGLLPVQFLPGQNAKTLGLTGRETFDVTGIQGGLEPRQQVTVNVKREDGTTFSFKGLARVDTKVEVDYFQNGGMLHAVLRRIMKEGAARQ